MEKIKADSSICHKSFADQKMNAHSLCGIEKGFWGWSGHTEWDFVTCRDCQKLCKQELEIEERIKYQS